MKLIPLSQGKFAQVDDEDYDHLMQWKWYAQHDKGKYYPTRGYYNYNTKNMDKIRIHNIIINHDPIYFIDHIDKNPLNNQKSNLRLATLSQNARNKSPKKNGSSRYLGVNLNKNKIKLKSGIKTYFSYHCIICTNYKKIYIGRFPFTTEGEILAAKAYDKAAKKYHGEFANLNFK